MNDKNKRIQIVFNPANELNFANTGWYTFERKTAMKNALRKRNKAAKAYEADGWQVTKFVERNQPVTLGGIGSGKAEITVEVNVYGFDAIRQ